eukprot:2807628-Pleurochrysis_carterae.AAC.1
MFVRGLGNSSRYGVGFGLVDSLWIGELKSLRACGLGNSSRYELVFGLVYSLWLAEFKSLRAGIW